MSKEIPAPISLDETQASALNATFKKSLHEEPKRSRSPAPPASPPPEGDIKKIASIWVEQNWKYLLWNDISPRLERKYTDCCRHEFVPIEKLAEAKQQGRAEALEECLRESERKRGVIRMPTVGHSAQSFGQDWAYTNIIEWLGEKLGRPTPSKEAK